MAERTIDQVQQAYTNEWMEIPGVEGIAIGFFEDEHCIKILSSRPVEELKGKIPSVIEGYPIIIEETGTFRVFDQ